MPYIPTMPKNRTFSAIGAALLVPLAAWAQAPPSPTTPPPPAGSVQAAAAANEPPTEAEKQLDEAVKKVVALRSVSADLVLKVDMLDQKFRIEGRYLKGPNNRVYLRLTVHDLPDAKGTMLQVCDGETLWDYKQILETSTYSKLGVAPILEKLKSPELDESIREKVVSQFGFAGPDELLKGLRRAVKFDQKASATLDGKAVWKLTGQWTSREGLFGHNQQPLPATAQLPAYVPDQVILHVGKNDGWPYKVRLVGRTPSILQEFRKRGPDGRLEGAKKSIQAVKPTVIELTYFNVSLNPDLKLDEFVFEAPPKARVEDATQAIVTRLDQEIQMVIARKKAEAAKGDGSTPNLSKADEFKGETPTLKQSIEVPRTGGVGPSAVPGSNPR